MITAQSQSQSRSRSFVDVHATIDPDAELGEHGGGPARTAVTRLGKRAAADDLA